MFQVCKFNSDQKIFYTDETGIEKPFVCPYEIMKDNLCIFHNEKFAQSNPDQISKKFKEIVEREKDKEILFIGCYLSFVNLKNISLNYINFSHATFQEYFSCDEISFKKKVDFTHTTFKKGVSFTETQFENQVTFRNCTFENTSIFSVVQFLQMVNFKDVTFKGNVSFLKSTFHEVRGWDGRFEGFTDFRESVFDQKADFLNAKFLDEANFSYVTFKKEIDFTETEFHRCSFNFTKFFDYSFFIFQQIL
jgi:uncharacterized protein YjbI with pentapeptide repeats